MNPIVSVHNLVKKFGDLAAVNGISLEVNEGELFAFLGPNGAGKTTTIKMLITLLAPTSGNAAVCGLDVRKQASEVRHVIGYVPQLISVDGTLTAHENLMLMARLYGVPRAERKKRVIDILSFLQLADHSQALVRTFSGGMIRKLEVGQAIVHHPRVLFLDEPTTGLDPIAKQSVWEHLLELRKQFGTTIFFTTHNMDEAAETADRVAIMDAGKISTIGTVSELTSKVGKEDATLEDAFILFTGNSLAERSNFRDVKRGRQTERRLG